MSDPASNLINGTIDSIAFGGAGVLRHDGLVVFVPFTAPGDEIVAEIVDQKKSHARASLVEVKHPSGSRVSPDCRYFGRCGGCHLQHISYASQLLAKQAMVQDALRRIGKIETVKVGETEGADAKWHYRRHIRLHMRLIGPTLRLGYMSEDAKRLLEVDACPIFTPDDDSIVSVVRKLVQRFKPHADNCRGGVSILKAEQGQKVLLFDFETSMPKNAEEVLRESLPGTPQIAGIVLKDPRRLVRMGNVELTFELDGLHFAYGPMSFVQAHAEQSGNLYRDVVARIASLGPKRVLDLYCGIGVTSLLVANQGIEVVAVEGNPEAIQLAKQNAAQNQIGNVSWHLANVDEVTGDLLGEHQPEVVLLNPPRTGLNPEVKEALTRVQPAHIFYISCMPATMARDIAALAASGYEVALCQPYDLFPQTTHVETLLHLKWRR